MELAMRNILFPCVFVMAICVVYPLESSAQIVSNGYICAPKNIGGEDTRLFFRQQDGVAENLSSSATFPVVCPIVIDYYSYPEGLYGLGITFRNGSSSTQTFQCALEEYSVDAVKQRSIGKAVSVAPGEFGVLSYELMQVLSEFSYSSVRCILPPRGKIAELAWF